jgi:hypothetical protein
MKVSDLIVECVNYIKEYGDKEVKISIITENGDYEFKPHGADNHSGNNFYIDLDIENVKEFKQVIK